MAKHKLGMFLNVPFQLMPVAFLIACLFAGGTNGKQATQRFDLGQGILQLKNEPLSLLLRPLALGF